MPGIVSNEKCVLSLRNFPRTSELAKSQQINHAARGLSNERTNKVVTPSQADEPAISEEIWRVGPVAATNLLTTTDVVFVKISLIFCCHVLRELECVSRPGANGIHSVECTMPTRNAAGFIDLSPIWQDAEGLYFDAF